MRNSFNEIVAKHQAEVEANLIHKETWFVKIFDVVFNSKDLSDQVFFVILIYYIN